MSRRNQSRRRRTYGRRQHEVRERRINHDPALDGVDDPTSREDWLSSDSADDPRGYGPAFGSYAQ